MKVLTALALSEAGLVSVWRLLLGDAAGGVVDAHLDRGVAADVLSTCASTAGKPVALSCCRQL